MKIEIKKRKILFLLIFVVAGILCGGGFHKAQAASQSCALGLPAVTGEPQCDMAQGLLCAYNAYFVLAGSDFTQAYCSKPADTDSNQCIVGVDANCNACDGYMSDGSGKVNVPNNPVESDISRPLYFHHGIGCKAPTFCVNSGSKVDIHGFKKDLYECQDQSNACGKGQGVDNDGNPAFCPDVNKPCSRKKESTDPEGKGSDMYHFTLIGSITLEKIGGGSDTFDKGNEIYCRAAQISDPEKISSKEELNFCTIQKWIGPLYGTQWIKDGYKIDNVTAADLAKIKPQYGCDSGSAFWAVFNNTIGRVIAIVLGLIFAIIALVCTVLLILILAFLEWIISMGGLDLNIVSVIWTMLRDIANMFFILILLYIAFNVALRRQGNVTKMLPGFFAAVLLINFSKIICQVVIDFSQFLISFVYGLSALNTGGSVAERGWGIVNYVAKAAGLPNLYSFWQPGVFQIDDSNSMLNLVGTIGVLVLGIIYMLAAVIVYGVAAILLAYRIVILWILTGVSPLIYAAWGAGMKSWVSKFWSEFLKTAFFAPAMIFCILLSLYALSPAVGNNLNETETIGEESQAAKSIDDTARIKANEILNDNTGGTTTKLPADVAKFNSFIQLIFALCFMWAGIVVAKKASIAGSNAVLSGAEKMMKQGANWLTMYKPAKAGLKKAGKWSWGRALESRAGKYLKVFSPTVWKQAAENRRKRRKEEIYTPRIAEMQARLAGTGAFLFGRGRKYREEKMYAAIQIAQMQNKIAKEIDETNVFSDHIIKLIDEEIKRTGGRLTPSIAGKLIALTERGDDNDLMKLSEALGVHTGGRVNIGALEKMMRKTFGNNEETVNISNRMMEAMKKAKYLQLFGGIQYDKERGENVFTLDSLDNEIGQEAERIGMNAKTLKDRVLDNLEKAAYEIEEEISKIKTDDPGADTSQLEAIRNIKYEYEAKIEANQRGEYNKLSSAQKAQVNPGNYWPDGKSPNKPEGAKYGGSTGDISGLLSFTEEDVKSFGRFRQGRTHEAFVDNEGTLNKVWERVEAKIKHFNGKAEEQRNIGNTKMADQYEKIARDYQRDLEKNKKMMPQLYALLRRGSRDSDYDQRIEDLQRGGGI